MDPLTSWLVAIGWVGGAVCIAYLIVSYIERRN